MRMLILFAMVGSAFFSNTATFAQDLPQQYREPFAESWPIRKAQHLQMKAYLDNFTKRARDLREVRFPLDFSTTTAYESSLQPIRHHLQAIHGFPPPKAIENPTPRFEFVAEDQTARIYRVWTKVFDGVEAYGLYMVPRHLQGKAPVIIAVHGGSGCPEAICDLDTRVNYRSFGQQAVKQGYIVYAPGILMAVSYADPPDPRIAGATYLSLEQQARRLGTSTRSLQIYQIIEGTKAVVHARPEADGERIGMTGLSMGGSYTLVTMPMWPAIKVGVCSAGFRVPTPTDNQQLESFRVSRQVSRAALVGLICPRPLMIQTGKADTVVPLAGARRGLPQARGYYEKLGISDRFEFSVHDGAHVFENEAIFRFFDTHLR